MPNQTGAAVRPADPPRRYAQKENDETFLSNHYVNLGRGYLRAAGM
jgi:hypothetical protein